VQPPRARDLLEHGAPAGLHHRRRGVGQGPLATPVGRYLLRRWIPSTSDYGGECFHAVEGGPQYEVSLFARLFPEAHLTPELKEVLRRRMLATTHATESIFELFVHEGQAIVISELVEGVSLAELREVLDDRGARLPWTVVLALAGDICARLGDLRKADVPLPAITPARLRISLWGRIYACIAAPELVAGTPWHRRLTEVLLPVLALGADAEERELLGRFGGDYDRGALGVIADALVERHPELAPALPALVDDNLDAGRPPRQLIEESLDLAALRAFWSLVLEVIETREDPEDPDRG
jgi:hypothetical protein